MPDIAVSADDLESSLQKKEGVCKKGSISYYTKANELWHGNQSKQGDHPTKPNDDSGFGDGCK
jgi:hypothetical protein